MKETRTSRAANVTVPDDGSHTFEAVVMNYGVVDSYNTIFDAGVFTESLEKRMPKITWGHNWTDPIGRYVDYVDTDESLTLIGELDDPEAVPRSKQAYAQLRSGTIDAFSVGFERDRIAEDDEGRTHFVKAGLDEAALVLAGAVPGTKLVSLRSASGLSVVRQVPFDVLEAVSAKVAAGEMSQEQAAIALDLAAGEITPVPEPVPDDGTESAADEALEALGIT